MIEIELHSKKSFDVDSKYSSPAKTARKKRNLTTNHSSTSIDCKNEQADASPGNAQSSSEANDDHATSIVGPDKIHITTNLAVLEATNPVLKHMLYGVDLIKTDPKLPIVWSEF